MKAPVPKPSAAELETLELHISDWRNRTLIEQAICLAVLRGHRYPTKITTYLGLDAGDFEAALAGLLGHGLIRGDSDRILLY